MASSATLQTPYAPQILQLPACLLACFYSAAVVEFYSALDTMNGKVRIPVKWASDSGDVGRSRSEATLVVFYVSKVDHMRSRKA